MADFFWGVELTKENPTAIWPFDSDEAEEDVEYSLNLRRVCLGLKAKEGERNIIVVSTVDADGASVASTIARLKAGGLEQDNLHLDFFSSVTLKLVQGSGPVHLSGVYVKSPGELEEDDTADGDDFLSNLDMYKPMKRSASGAKESDPPAKRPRVAGKAEDESEEDSEEDDSDDDMAVDMIKKPVTSIAVKTATTGKSPAAKAAAVVSAGKTAAAQKKAPVTIVAVEDDDEDDEEDDDDEDDDEDDDDDEEDDDEDDEEDEDGDEPTPLKKQPMMKNKQIAAIQQQVKAKQQQQRGEVRTPQPKAKPAKQQQQKNATPSKQPAKQQEKATPSKKQEKATPSKQQEKATPSKQQEKATPSKQQEKATPSKQQEKATPSKKQEKATPSKQQEKATPSKPQGPVDVDTIKKKLLSSPNVPKKPEKFANMLKSTYKVTDQKKVTELWQWLQKNKK